MGANTSASGIGLSNGNDYNTQLGILFGAPDGLTTTGGSATFTADVSGSVHGLVDGTGGSGSLSLVVTVAGGNTLTLSGTNTYTGGTTITAGTLAVTGVTLNGTMTVLNGTLSNTGTVGTVDNQTGGRFVNSGSASVAGAVSNAGTGSNAGRITSLTNTAGTFDNTGTITGGARVLGGAVTSSGSIASGVAVLGGTLDVSGTIVGGASVSGGTLVISNVGQASGTASISVGTSTNGTLTNNGLWSGDAQNGPSGTLTNNGTWNGTITNAGQASNAGTTTSVSNTGGTFTNAHDISGNVSVSGGTLSNSGHVYGVSTISSGTLSNTGTVSSVTNIGGTFVNSGSGSLAGAVTNSGTASNAGTIASLVNSGGTFTNTGSISNSAFVSITGGTVSNSNWIASNTTITAGTLVNTGTVYAAVSNRSGGIFVNSGTSSYAGTVTNAGTASNAGRIESLTNTGGTFTNTGTIVGSAWIDNGSVSNSGRIVVGAAVTGGTLTNTGTVGTVTNVSSGTFVNSGSDSLVGYLNNSGAASNEGTITELTNWNNTVTNTGTITTVDNRGPGTFVNFGSASVAGNVTNAGTASNAGRVASLTNTGGTFTNTGTVSGGASVSGGSVTNSGRVVGASTVSSGTLSNSGTITGASTISGGTLSNTGTVATVNNLAAATFVNSGSSSLAGAVTNSGTASNAGTIASLVNSGGTFTNTGTVSGGASVSGGSVTNSGRIVGASTVSSGTLSNSGSVEAVTNQSGGTFANTGTLAGALTNSGNAHLSGTIVGGMIDNTSVGAVSLTGNLTTDSSVTNAGSFDLSSHRLSGVTSFVNTGTVTSTAGAAIGASSIENRGLISGGAYGLYLSNATTLTNYGTISGGTGSVFLAVGGNTIDIKAGSSFVGAIDYNNTTANTTAFDAGSWTLPVNNYRVAGNTITFGSNKVLILTGIDGSGNGNIVVTGYSPPITSASERIAGLNGSLHSMIGGILAIDPVRPVPGFDHGMRTGYADENSGKGASATAIDRMIDGGTAVDKWGNLMWLRATGEGSFRPSNGGDPGSVSRAYALSMGLDRQVEDWRVGFFAGSGYLRSDLTNGSERLEGMVGFGGIYGRHAFGEVIADFDLTLGGIGGHTKRSVNAGTETATGRLSGLFASPSVALSRRIPLNAEFFLTPAAKMRYTTTWFGGYTESGSSQNATYAQSFGHDLEERLELKGTWEFKAASGMFGKLEVFGDAIAAQKLGNPRIDASISGVGYTVADTTPSTRWGGSVGLSTSVSLASGLSFYAGGDGTLYSDHSKSFGVNAGVKLPF